MRRSGHRWAAAVVLVLATAGSVASSWTQLRSDPALGITNVAVAVSFFLVAVLLREGRRQGTNSVLMALAGVFYLASWWYQWPTGWHVGPTAWFSFVGGYLWFVCAGAVLMRYPDDAFRHTYERLYFVVLGTGILTLKIVLSLVGRPEWAHLPAGTPWWGPGADLPTYQLLAVLFNVMVAASALVMFVLLVRKYVTLERGFERDEAAPLLVAVWAVGALGGLYILARLLSLPDGAVDVLRLLTALSALATPLAFTVALLRPRLLRSSVADLVTALSGTPSDVEIVQALRAGLRTERIELHPADAVEAVPGLLVERILGGDKHVLRDLVLPLSFRRHRRLVDAVRAVVATTIENRERLDAVAAMSERIATIADDERRRIESELHNGAQAQLLIIDARLALLPGSLEASEAGEEIADIRQQLDFTLTSLRDLAHGIYPPLLKQSGLRVALEETVVRPLGRDIQLAIEGEPLPTGLRHTLFSVCSEAITNMVKHTGARTRMTITLARSERHVDLRIRDDGPGGATASGFGLSRMRDGVVALRGAFRLDSPTGLGTTIDVRLPCA